MVNREDGLNEIYERLKLNREILGLKSFKRTPTSAPAVEIDMPCVFMNEGVDTIVGHGSRSKAGYPAKRVLEVILELIVSKETDIKKLYRNVRRVVFTERGSDPVVFNPIIANNTFINENRTEGPNGYGLPDVVGMRLVLDLVYTDDPFTINLEE